MECHERMGIAHDLHTSWNPVSEEVVDEQPWALDLQPGMRVLNVACEVGEMLQSLSAAVGNRPLPPPFKTHRLHVPVG